MRYKRRSLIDLTQDQLRSYMAERGFRFGLLNYAAVVADVLGECSILSKSPNQLRYGMADARKLVSAIRELRDNCLALVKTNVARLNPDTESDLLTCCRELEEARKKLKGRTESLADFLPQLEARPRPIRKINQIALLWARGFVAEPGRILWKEAGEFYYWFIKHFRNESQYSELISYDFDIESIKKLFERLDKKYYALFQTASLSYYFPTISMPPRIRVVSPDREEKALSIVSIEFFSNKIMTYYESDRGVLARETMFKQEGPVSRTSRTKPMKETSKEEHLPLRIDRG